MLWTLMGCASLLSFTVEESAEASVEGAGLLETQVLDGLGFEGFTELDLSESQQLADQGIEPGDIVEISLSVLSLRVLSPDDGDLSFLSSMELWIEAPGESRAGGVDGGAGGRTGELLFEWRPDLTPRIVAGPITRARS